MPSRMTMEVFLTMARSFLVAFDALYSCQKPSRLLTIIITKIIIASVGPSKNNDNAAAKRRMRIIGLLNCERNRTIALDLFSGFNKFGPYCTNLLVDS